MNALGEMTPDEPSFIVLSWFRKSAEDMPSSVLTLYLVFVFSEDAALVLVDVK